MIETKVEPDRLYDRNFENVISSISTSTNENDDDFLLLAIGATGTGKSMLMLHGEELYMKEKASVKYIGLNRQSFASALKLSKSEPLPRFCGNDEANISKRDALTKYNKDLIDLYFAIRGLNIFHWWNNPSIDMLDKHFIKERIKGVIYITTKDRNRPRVYYYFRKEDLLKMLEKYGNLELRTIKKIRKEYAYYKGWFKDYKGNLLKSYLDKKGHRMNEKVDDFFMNYGQEGDMISGVNIRKEMGVSRSALFQYEKELMARNLMTKENKKVSSSGRNFYTQNCLELFKKIADERLHKQINDLKNQKNEIIQPFKN